MTSPTIRDRVAAALGRKPNVWDSHESCTLIPGSDLTEILDKLDAMQASHARAVEDMGDAVEARQKAEQELCAALARNWQLRSDVSASLRAAGVSVPERSALDAGAIVRGIDKIATCRDAYRDSYARAVDKHSEEMTEASRHAESLRLKLREADRDIAELRSEFQKSNHAVKCEFDRSNRLMEAASEDTKRIKSLEDTLAAAEQRIEGLKDTLRNRDEVIAELRQKLDTESLAGANTRHTLRQKVAEQKAQIDSLREELSKANEQVHELTIANREESRAFATVRDSAVERRLATAEACISLLAQMPAEVSKLARRVAEMEGGASHG